MSLSPGTLLGRTKSGSLIAGEPFRPTIGSWTEVIWVVSGVRRRGGVQVKEKGSVEALIRVIAEGHARFRPGSVVRG
jgi:hypothetical protein